MIPCNCCRGNTFEGFMGFHLCNSLDAAWASFVKNNLVCFSTDIKLHSANLWWCQYINQSTKYCAQFLKDLPKASYVYSHNHNIMFTLLSDTLLNTNIVNSIAELLTYCRILHALKTERLPISLVFFDTVFVWWCIHCIVKRKWEQNYWIEEIVRHSHTQYVRSHYV